MNRRAVLFLLWMLQGLAACAWLALLPGDAGHGLLLGFSSARLALLGSALALAAGSGALAWRFRRNDPQLGPALHDGLILAAVLGVFIAPLAILVLRALGQTSGFVYTAYAERLAPLAGWFTLAGLEWLAWEASAEREAIRHSLAPARGMWRACLYALIGLGLLAALVSTTQLGLKASADGSWGSPSTPLLEWQIALALACGVIVMSLGTRHWKWLGQERWMALLVYLFACLVWLSQPIRPGFFATPPRAPNFEIYPFSDALIYAQYAQSALAGYGFQWPDVPTRPLYIAGLTWLHALGGQDYGHVIALQTLVLAAFPAVLYLLGRELGSRPLGIGLALLATLRDLTANVAAPFALNYTYSKLFFSEMPAALLISLFALMALRWMRGRRPGSGNHEATEAAATDWYPLLAGGVLGLAALIRLQSAVILIAVIPLGFFVMKDRRRWAAGSALMALGVALALLPWLARNYRATGGLVLDNPTSQAMTLARRWSGDNGNDLIPYLPGEGAAQYSNRMTQLALGSLQANPGRILGAAVAHFFNNEVDNLLVFPLRDRLDSASEVAWPAHAFWQSWNGQPGAGQMALIAIYLVLFGVGLGTAWHKNGPAGLLPLGISLVYNAWTALFLSSGDRFLVPVDWGVYLYHFLGLLALAGLGLSLLKGARESAAAWLAGRYEDTIGGEAPGLPGWRGLAVSAALILLAGASIPVTEAVFPKITPGAAPARTPAAGEIVIHGRAVYPRYYEAGDGEPGTAKLGYGKSDEARLVFFLAGPANTLVIFPLKTAPAFFPNAADVVVIGVQEDGFVRGREIVVEKDGKEADYVP